MMRQSKITMKNGTSHVVRHGVEHIESVAKGLLEQKGWWIKLEDLGQNLIVIAIPEISTIEDAGLWRAQI